MTISIPRQLWDDLILNTLLLLICLPVATQMAVRMRNSPTWLQSVLRGLLLGGLGVLLMLFRPTSPGYVYMNLTPVLIVVGGAFFGPGTALITSLLIGAAKWGLLGQSADSIVAGISLLVMGGLVALISSRSKQRIPAYVSMTLACLAVISITISVFLDRNLMLHLVFLPVYFGVSFGAYHQTHTILAARRTARKSEQQELDNRVLLHELAESEERYRRLVELSPEVVFVCSVDRILFANEQAARMLMLPSAEAVIGREMIEFVYPEDQEYAGRMIPLAFQRSPLFSPINEVRLIRSDGSVIYVRLSSAMMEYNHQPALLNVMHDVTREKEADALLREANTRLHALSQIDGLTSLYNRRYLDESLARSWAEGLSEGRPVALLMLDVDYFKSYNDSYGHLQGDECLQQIAACLAQLAAEHGWTAGRYGGEEFGLIMPGASSEEARSAAEALLERINRMFLLHAGSPLGHVTVSIGVGSLVPEPGLDPKALVQLADAALYEAKHTGKNCVRGF